MPRGYELRDEDARPEEERHRHTIMASNFLMGIALFLEVQLPERWRLETGRSLPEVNRTRTLGDNLWVVDGTCTYVMYDEGVLKAYELQVRVSERGGRDRRTPGLVFVENTTAGGHQARVERGEVQQGLFRRKSMPMVAVDFSCPYTYRHLRLELRGRLDGEDLDIFLRSLEDLVCH
ncbi:MAG: hypothetical protein ACE5HJ_07570 [Thermoplasmata archaeon]